MFRSPFLPGVELETALSNSAEARMTLNSSKAMEMNEENRTMWVGSVVYDRPWIGCGKTFHEDSTSGKVCN